MHRFLTLAIEGFKGLSDNRLTPPSFHLRHDTDGWGGGEILKGQSWRPQKLPQGRIHF